MSSDVRRARAKSSGRGNFALRIVLGTTGSGKKDASKSMEFRHKIQNLP